MKPAVIRLVDLGLDEDFATSVTFAQAIVSSLTTRRYDRPAAEIEFIRTRDIDTVHAALVNPTEIIHLMAHGETAPEDLGFWSDDEETTVYLSDLAEWCADWGEGVEVGTFFADCCDTAQARFVRGMRDSLEKDVCYIGAKRATDWYESTTFASAFYSAYFRNKGRGMSSTERGLAAGEKAVQAFEAIVGPCPFKVMELSPSRTARRLLAD